jgi:xanthine dehydrogenase accessory factor
MTPEVLAALAAARESRRPVVLATRLPTGEQMLLPDEAASPALAAAGEQALADDKTGTVKIDNGEWFLQVYNTPLRLIVVGAVHIAQALVPMISFIGYAVTVVDPRRSFATDDRFPNVAVSGEWPDDAMDLLRPDARTAIVTLTHDPKLDDPALDRALKSNAFYIGALGSRKTHAARLGRLRELGHDEASLERIHAPVGLNIAAVTAPEIALSIVAEIVAVRRGAAMVQKAT